MMISLPFVISLTDLPRVRSMELGAAINHGARVVHWQRAIIRRFVLKLGDVHRIRSTRIQALGPQALGSQA